MIKVLLADDQPLVRTGFQMILDAEADIEVTGEACDGADAVLQFGKLQPDVVVMDIRMPVLDGISATRQITADEGARPWVLVLTTFHLDEYVVAALRAGASGFLLKDVEAAKLTEAIRVIASGHAIVDPVVTRRLLDQFARLPDPALKPPGPPGPAAGSPASPAARSRCSPWWPAGCFTRRSPPSWWSPTTVKTHVHHLLTKLGARDRVQLVILAYDAGLAGRPSILRSTAALSPPRDRGRKTAPRAGVRRRPRNLRCWAWRRQQLPRPLRERGT